MHIERKLDRTNTDIVVTITSVLETREASITNLTEHGAQVSDISLPVGTRFQIDYQGQTVFAVVAWSEIDRVGARFLFSLVDGPLHDRLMQARMSDEVTNTHGGNGWVPNASRLSAYRQPSAGFGRRRG
jgi:hypothetical protein